MALLVVGFGFLIANIKVWIIGCLSVLRKFCNRVVLPISAILVHVHCVEILLNDNCIGHDYENKSTLVFGKSNDLRIRFYY